MAVLDRWRDLDRHRRRDLGELHARGGACRQAPPCGATCSDPFGTYSLVSPETALVGNSNGNTLKGGAGPDILLGDGGNDTLNSNQLRKQHHALQRNTVMHGTSPCYAGIRRIVGVTMKSLRVFVDVRVLFFDAAYYAVRSDARFASRMVSPEALH